MNRRGKSTPTEKIRQEFEQAAFRLSSAERAGYDNSAGTTTGTSKEANKSRQKRPRIAGVIQPAPQQAPQPQARSHGRLASTMAGAELRWFINGWFANGMVNILIGRKNVGKSSCLSWLLSQAKRPVILPGYEESVELMMLPRWRSNKVLLRSLLVLNDQHYTPSLQIALLVSILKEHRADLLVVENLDSYLPADASTNDSQAVRPYLEGLHRIAAESGVCLVGTRHPGKDPGNLCPGSHCWEDVPRISAVLEREDGPPVRHWMWSHRCGVGVQPAPLTYTLERTGADAPVFCLAQSCDKEALQIAQAAPDALDRSRLQAALDLLGVLLSQDWVECKVVFAEAQKEALGEGTMRRAAGLLGVQTRREGNGLNHKSYWGRKGLDRPWSESNLL